MKKINSLSGAMIYWETEKALIRLCKLIQAFAIQFYHKGPFSHMHQIVFAGLQLAASG